MTATHQRCLQKAILASVSAAFRILLSFPSASLKTPLNLKTKCLLLRTVLNFQTGNRAFFFYGQSSIRLHLFKIQSAEGDWERESLKILNQQFTSYISDVFFSNADRKKIVFYWIIFFFKKFHKLFHIFYSGSNYAICIGIGCFSKLK